MNEKNSYILCSTIHDPEFKLKTLLKSTFPVIKNPFSLKILCCTSPSIKFSQFFRKQKDFIIITSSSLKQVDSYRFALKTCLDNITNPQTQKIFYIDFDRLIHWIHSYPEELKDLLKKDISADYLLIGRSKRAFETHPSTQKNTERLINEIGSKVLGFSKIKDLISVCYIFTKELCEKILNINNLTNTGFYGIWPIILWMNATKKQYLEVEGLEWETPDRFHEDINKIGYTTWLNQYQSSDEWKKRTRFIHDFLLELFDILEIKLLK